MRHVIVLSLLVGLAACNGRPVNTCEVISPPQVILPTTQDDQRVEAQSTGDPVGSGQAEQRCP
ncbi:hypothetical protein [Pseudomonas mangiferae]|uniref:Uncharacterized protein n=1 Tax=Pseudomonas mangiferae TaxID=2593654 RepID=A0A553GTY7_9PSED|nr:hypothetical protein [Pseudomonas mangiferae]TRX72965.1 hypothetical protein FM069_20130 [Pseudomonas mangiferae]